MLLVTYLKLLYHPVQVLVEDQVLVVPYSSYLVITLHLVALLLYV